MITTSSALPATARPPRVPVWVFVGLFWTLVALNVRDPGRADAKAQVLEKTAYTPPTLVGTTLYLRDRKEIVALDLK